jgi:hypothetical protein
MAAQGGSPAVAISLASPADCRAAAERLLAEKERRLRHVRGVAALADDLARRASLTSTDRDTLVSAAWLHDIGYADALCVTGWHPLDGAMWLRARGQPRLAALVAHHSQADMAAAELGLDLSAYPREESLVADLLDYADLCTSPDGRRVSPEARLDEIESRAPGKRRERPARLALARKVEAILPPES